MLDLHQKHTEADEQIERIKAIVRTEEERIRQKTAETLQQKTKWKQQQLFGAFPGPPNNDTSHFMMAFISALLFMTMMTCLLLWLR